MTASPPSPNPKRVAAGRLNRQKRRGLTPEGRERLRQAARVNRPWEHTTGPKTPEGKARAAGNGKQRQKGLQSVREIGRSLAGFTGLVSGMAASRQLVAELLGGQRSPLEALAGANPACTSP